MTASLAEILSECSHTAWRAYRHAMGTMSLEERRRTIGEGADGTETFLLDVVVEEPVLEVLERHGVNVLSEEVGWIDRGSSVTVVIDPVDGTANAAAGVPIAAFAAAAVVDEVIEEARVLWFDTGREWAVSRRDVRPSTVTGRTVLDGASVSLLRPRESTVEAWYRLAGQSSRVRVLGSSVVEACLVADGAIDLFCDPGGDVHRIVDIAATKLLVEQAGGCVLDLHARPFTFEPDLGLRWSGVFAASPELADAAIACILG
ncbi:MAG: inositol monophosphatase [Actinomycetota bacterium]|nr:inositol monophosphatase [Actinomycetota bacterium]MDA3027673.1 inositol monophosphatase [Actinomycetota bacterium]